MRELVEKKEGNGEGKVREGRGGEREELYQRE